jgi:hypothetical protein
MRPCQNSITRHARITLALLTFAALWFSSGPVSAQILNGPAKRAIERHLGAAVVQTLLPSPVFYGDFDGDGRQDAVAFVYAGNAEGDGVRLDVLMFTGAEDGFRFLRKASSIAGENPRNVRIQPGRVSFVLMTPDPDDPDATRTKPYTIRTTTVAARLPAAPSDVQQTGSIARGMAGGMLGKRLCSVNGQIQFNGGQLVVQADGEPYIMTDVVFEGCDGKSCTYRQPQHSRVWVTTRQGAAIVVRGPIKLESDAGRLRLVDGTASYGPCR